MFHGLGDELPNPTGTCYFDACQVVETQLEIWIFLHEYTNMFVVLAIPDMCVVFFRFSLRNILVVAPVTLLFVDNIGVFRP